MNTQSGTAPDGPRHLEILIVDDHTLVRAGIRRILESSATDWAIEEAGSAMQALEILRRRPVDIAIVDLAMPGVGGLELTRRIAADFPKTSVLVLSMHTDDQYSARAFRNGAHGYLTKDSAAEQLVTALDRIASGHIYVTPRQAEQMVMQLRPGRPAPAHDTLSDREMDVLRRIVGGQRVKDIADQLHLSIKTVSTHKTRIQEKLRLPSTAALVRYGMEQGLAEEPLPSGPAPLDVMRPPSCGPGRPDA